MSESQMKRAVSITALSPLMIELLAQGCSVELTVTGNSMRPFLHHGVSQVRLASGCKPSKGDILLYRRDSGVYVLHRAVALIGDTVACCGDAQWHLEKGIRSDQILALVTDFSRAGKKWTACQHPIYQLYWRVWLGIRPLRRLIGGGIRKMRRGMRFVRFHD